MTLLYQYFQIQDTYQQGIYSLQNNLLPREVKFTEKRVEWWLPGAWGKEEGEEAVFRYRVLVLQGENVLEIGCTTLKLTLLNCTLGNGSGDTFYVMCFLPQLN